MKKRVWGILLCMMLLCTAATAADSVTLGGVGMGDGNGAMYFVNGAAAAVNVEPASWNAKLESVGSVLTLTLDGADISGDIELEGAAEIVVESDSTVSGRIYALDELTLRSGSGRSAFSCAEIAVNGTGNLDLTLSNVDYAGGFSNANVGHADLLTLENAAVTTLSLMWMSDGGVVLAGASTLDVSDYFWAERLQMNDAAVVTMNTPLWNYGHTDVATMEADLGRYLPAGYKIGIDTGTTVVYDGGANDGLEAAPVVLQYLAPAPPPSRPAIKHRCESKCAVCGGCEDLACFSARCADKCTLLVLPFTDVAKDAWYAQAVAHVTHLGIMEGTSETTFSPLEDTSRAMLVTVLWRMEGEPVVNYALPFPDVASESWYTEAVRWAASERIVLGYGSGLFGGEDTVTREQAVTIFHRYAQWKGLDVSVGAETNILSYVDAFDVGDWAMAAMQWGCGAGILRGALSNGEAVLEPARLISRAETAALLYQYLENVAK